MTNKKIVEEIDPKALKPVAVAKPVAKLTAEEMKAQKREVAIIRMLDVYENLLKGDIKGIEDKFFTPGHKDEVEGEQGKKYLEDGLKNAQKELQIFWEEKKQERAVELVEKRRAKEGALLEINHKNWEVLELDVEINKLFNNTKFADVFAIKQNFDNKINRLERQVMQLMKTHGIGYSDLSDESTDKNDKRKKKAKELKKGQ
jgi:hypothetical protein